MPIIVGDKDNILSYISKVEGKPMTFHLGSLAPLKYQKGLTLVPFSSLHECRYMVYWPVVSDNEWKIRLAEQEMDEKARIALEMVTADKVICGEQQPESDHFAAMAESFIGDDNGRHWRTVRQNGWFSYVLNTSGIGCQYVRFICAGREGSEATVEINGNEAGTVKIAGTGEEIHVIMIPEEFRNADLITVKVMHTGEGMSPKFYETRLVKE